MFDFKIGSDDTKKVESSGGMYDLVIIGAGPAGLATAIYAARDDIKTLVLEKSSVGGLAATTELVENYPGFPNGVAGADLMDKFEAQAQRFGAEIVEFDEVEEVEPVAEGLLKVHTGTGGVFEGRMVLIATGSQPKRLGVPGEKEFYGRGLSYCATCDGPFFKDKDVVVIGAGNSGLQEGQSLLSYTKSVNFVEFLPYSPAEKILQERTMNHENSTFHFNQQVTAIKGDKKVTAVVMKDRETGEVREIPADGVFVYVGYRPDTEFVQALVETNRWGYIQTDGKMHTSVQDILAAGDVRADNVAQISVAVGDGTKAAITVRERLAELKAQEA